MHLCDSYCVARIKLKDRVYGTAGGGSSASKERVETLEQANQELERLCKAVQRLHHDLADAQQEAEVNRLRAAHPRITPSSLMTTLFIFYY